MPAPAHARRAADDVLVASTEGPRAGRDRPVVERTALHFEDCEPIASADARRASGDELQGNERVARVSGARLVGSETVRRASPGAFAGHGPGLVAVTGAMVVTPGAIVAAKGHVRAAADKLVVDRSAGRGLKTTLHDPEGGLLVLESAHRAAIREGGRPEHAPRGKEGTLGA